MAGYPQRGIKKSFSDLAGGGDYIEVIIRNPQTGPPEGMRRSAPHLPTAPDGPPPGPHPPMRGCPWAALQDPPAYVRRVFWDISQIRRRTEKERNPPPGGDP